MNGKLSIIALAMTITMAVAAQSARHSLPEQRHFSAEESAVTKPVALPQDVLNALRKDRLVQDILEDRNISPEKLPLDWFSASRVHLSKSGTADLVVMARGPLVGGNVVTFWVFRSTPDGYKLALTAPAHDLEIKNTRSKGYRDIELTAMTAREISTVLWRFDGKQYVFGKGRTEQIR